MKKKEYIMPATKVKEMQHRLSLLAGSPESITSGGMVPKAITLALKRTDSSI